jgi:hypothetical protein
VNLWYLASDTGAASLTNTIYVASLTVVPASEARFPRSSRLSQVPDDTGPQHCFALANDRDLATRRLLAFTALDTLQGLGAVAFDDACRLDRAENACPQQESNLRRTA